MGAEAAVDQGWSPRVLVAAAAAIWFVVVVPLAAWFEARRQRAQTRRVVPASRPPGHE